MSYEPHGSLPITVISRDGWNMGNHRADIQFYDLYFWPWFISKARDHLVNAVVLKRTLFDIGCFLPKTGSKLEVKVDFQQKRK